MASPGSIRAGKAHVEMGLDDAKLKGGLKSTESRLKSFGKELKGIGLALGGVAAGGFVALTATVRKFDEALDFAGKIGIAAGRLQELEHAAVLTGSSAESLRKALAKMLKTVGEAGQGNKEAVASLERLGLSADKLKALSPDQMFGAIADAMQKIPDAAGQMAAAMDVFGRGGGDIVQTLQLGKTGLASMAAEARQLGKVMSDETAAGINKANDALDRMGAILSGLAAKAATAFAPILEKLEQITNFIQSQTAGAPPTGVYTGEQTAPAMRGRMQELEPQLNAARFMKEYFKGLLREEGAKGMLGADWGKMHRLNESIEKAGAEIHLLDTEMESLRATLMGMPEATKEADHELEFMKGVLDSLKAKGGPALEKFGKGITSSLGGAAGNVLRDVGAFFTVGGGAVNQADTERFRAAEGFRQMGLSPANRRIEQSQKILDLMDQGFMTEDEARAANAALIESSGELADAFNEVKNSAERLPETMALGSAEAAAAILRHQFPSGAAAERVELDQLREQQAAARALRNIEQNTRDAVRLAPANI